MPEIHTPSAALKKRQNRLKWTLLSIWLLTSFGPGFFARDLAIDIQGWPLYFWMAAQGSLLVFMAIVVIYAWLMNRWEAEEVAQLSATHQRPSLSDTHESN
jgi:cation/acetate symporter